MRKAEITKAIGYKAELQTAIVRDECGYLAGPIKGLLAGFDSGLKGKEGVSVNYFCLIAKRFLVDIEPFKKKSGQVLLPGAVPMPKHSQQL